MIFVGAMIERLSGAIRVRRTVVRAVAAVLLLELAGVAAWRFYDDRRTGRVVLTNDGPPLTLQVLGESGDEPIGEPVELIRRTTLALPAGDYRLRITGEGRLSRTYRFAVNAGETFNQALTLDENRLLGEATIQPPGPGDPPRRDPVPFTPDTVAIELTPGKADFVELLPTKLCRRDAATGQVVWDALEPQKPGQPPHRYHPWVLWFVRNHNSGIRPIDPAPDVDGDGTRDLVWATGSAFLALSGKDGSVLWTYLAELDGPGGAYPEGPELPGPIRPATRWAQLVDVPSAADLDRDGVIDVVSTIVFAEFPAETIRRRPELAKDQMARSDAMLYRRVVVAVSGRSGRRLWTYAIDPAFRQWPNRGWRLGTLVVSGGRSPTVAIVEESRCIGLDPADGCPRTGPIDLGFEPVRPVQYADLDGDGRAEILAIGPGSTGNDQALTAVSLATGRPLWTATINAKYQDFLTGTELDWPLVVDLDCDGRAEIAAPDSGALDPHNGYRGVRLLDGTTGRPRWIRPMRPETKGDDGLLHIIEAPDLDRDGVHDLVTASFFLGREPINNYTHGPGEEERVYIDAISGKDGRPLWWWHYDRPSDRYTHMVAPRWWGRGPDGWPLLAVPIDAQHPQKTIPPCDTDPLTVHVLEASTGREVQAMAEFTRMQVADLDGDGLQDLWGESRDESRGDLRAFRGEGPEVWRALGGFAPAAADRPDWYPSEFRPAADFDGDGIGDVLIARVTAPGETPSHANGSRTAIARSGRDGRLLWKADLGLRRGWFERDRGEDYFLRSLPMPAGDLDGDGTPDVIVQENNQEPPAWVLRRPAMLPLLVLSGRTGRPAWVAGPLPLEFEAHGYSGVQWAVPQVIEPGGAPDLLVRHSSPFSKASSTPPPPNSPDQDRLARVSGRTGRIVWDIPLEGKPRPPGFIGSAVPPPIFEDLDGDGGLDALLLVHSTAGAPNPGFDLKAVSLRDGRVLWSRYLEVQNAMWTTQVVVFDTEDSKRPAVAVSHLSTEGHKSAIHVRALDGPDGKPRWTRTESADLRASHEVLVARLGGDARRRVCLAFAESAGYRRILVLDADGRERLHRELPRDQREHFSQSVIDLDGDGRDELLFRQDGRYRALGPGLEELWSFSDPSQGIASWIPAYGGRPAEVVLPSGVALDGKSGRPVWLTPREVVWLASPGTLLDPGDSTRRPLLVYNPTSSMTIARSAMATTPAGVPSSPVGDPVPAGRADGDPRWTRPLPWTGLVLFTIGPKGFLAFVGLALINVAVPLALLGLAARRRPWTLRLLMALPVAAAVPLTVFQTVEPLVPAEIGSQPVSSRVVFALATLAGVPIVVFTVAVGWAFARRRWRRLALVAGLALVTSAIVAAAWLWRDSRGMPAIEHYDRSNWHLATLMGAYSVGVLILVGWPIRAAYRILRRPWRREVVTS
jgi:outer membrane protein assembly factor BamB